MPGYHQQNKSELERKTIQNAERKKAGEREELRLLTIEYWKRKLRRRKISQAHLTK